MRSLVDAAEYSSREEVTAGSMEAFIEAGKRVTVESLGRSIMHKGWVPEIKPAVSQSVEERENVDIGSEADEESIDNPDVNRDEEAGEAYGI